MTARTSARVRVTVYSRPDCHLCEELLEGLLPLLRGRAEVEVRDVDRQQDWQRTYGGRIPVVEMNGSVICEFRLDGAAVQRALDTFPDPAAGA
ncbi:MAG: glutaredoxin family protein [Woeseiaceae bacterium]